MDLNNVIVFDIETNGMLEDLDRLHVMSIGYVSDNGKWSIESMNDEDRIKSFFENPNNVMLGHNIIMYDIPAIEKLYPGVDIKCEIIDTLPISWYLYNERPKHSLESWGETFSTSETKKVAIDDWENLSYEDYVERCEGDIRINTNLWVKSLKLFRSLYDSDEEVVSVIKYLNFKTKCLKLQNDNPLRINVDQAKNNLEYLNKIIEEKKEELKKIMPKIPKYRLVSKPKKGLYKKDGSLSVAGEKWLTYLDGCGLPQDYDGEIKILHSEEEPNPASTLQIKDFLVSKGWKPKIFKDGANGKVAQLRDDNKNLCKSIYKLIEKYPELEALDGLSVAQHRYGILKGIVESVDENGYAPAQANGFTKTFRLKHKKPFVNLPKPTQQYGELIRSVIIAPEGYSVIGSDVGSLEDKTKQIAIYSYDKEYVEQMNTKGFDAHLDIGLSANMFNESEVEFFKWYKSWEKEKDESSIPEKYKNATLLQMEELYGKLTKKRHVAKTVNYACLPEDNTEVLTRDGWKNVESLRLGEDVLTYNKDKDQTEFSPIRYIHRYKDASVMSLKNKWWSIESTPDHRWYTKRRSKTRNKVKYVNEFTTTDSINTEISILNSAEFVGGDSDITYDQASLLGWIASDGYLKWAKDTKKTSSSKGNKRFLDCSISQSKKKFYSEIKNLINSLGLEYGESTNNSNVEVFKFSSPSIRNFIKDIGLEEKDKHQIDWVRLVLNMSRDALSGFFNSFYKGDGCSSKKSSTLTITQNSGNILNAIEICGNLLGYRTTKSIKKSDKSCFDVRFNKINYTTGQRLKKELSRVVDVFCLTTDNETFVIKQGKTITITGNCTYGAGAGKISESAKIPVKEAEGIIDAYWKRNWSVKQYAEDRKVKNVDGKDWVYNPYSRLWLYLTSDHIKFSACNQNSGAKFFDTWVYFMMQYGIIPSAQFHDEVLLYVKNGEEGIVKDNLHKAMEKVNRAYELPIILEVDVLVGANYAEVH